MASVSKSAPTSSSPDPRKISGQSRDHLRTMLLDVQDELHELAAIIAMLPHLHRFANVMHEIITPGPRRATEPTSCHDRIGRLLHELPKAQRTAANMALARIVDGLPEAFTSADHMDLCSALTAINTVLHYRLRRLTAIIATV